MAWSTVNEKKSEGKRTARNKVEELHPSGGNTSSDIASQRNSGDELATEKNKDLHSGMELLELDFLLGIVEDTKSNDQNDVTMRKLNFNEVLRRGKQNQIDSNALAMYAVSVGNLYGKDIQCEAMKELARRTAK
jgi:hypothetical protein